MRTKLAKEVVVGDVIGVLSEGWHGEYIPCSVSKVEDLDRYIQVSVIGELGARGDVYFHHDDLVELMDE